MIGSVTATNCSKRTHQRSSLRRGLVRSEGSRRRASLRCWDAGIIDSITTNARAYSSLRVTFTRKSNENSDAICSRGAPHRLSRFWESTFERLCKAGDAGVAARPVAGDARSGISILTSDAGVQRTRRLALLRCDLRGRAQLDDGETRRANLIVGRLRGGFLGFMAGKCELRALLGRNSAY